MNNTSIAPLNPNIKEMSSKKPTKSSNSAHFFWDKKASKHRSRFNLLLLEYGEYLLEDLSAFYFPIPTHDLSTAFEVKDSLKIQVVFRICGVQYMMMLSCSLHENIA